MKALYLGGLLALVTTFVMFAPSFAFAESYRDNRENPYWWQYRGKHTSTISFFVDNAELLHGDEHVDAQATNLPPPSLKALPGDRNQFGTFAKLGHLITDGESVVLSEWNTISKKYIFGRQDKVFKVLTIQIPKVDVGIPVTIDVSDQKAPESIVFWSYWGAVKGGCFAYANSGTIQFERISAPLGFPPLKKGDDERLYETFVADIDVRFDHIGDGDIVGELCPPFALKETIWFFRRDITTLP